MESYQMNKQKAILIALILSVSVNLLIAGVFIGRKAGYSGGMHERAGMGWMMHHMSEDTKKELKEIWHQHREAAMPLRQQLKQAQADMREAVNSEPFDPEAMRAALAGAREASANYQALRHEQMLTILARVPQEERAKVYRFLKRRSHQGCMGMRHHR